MITVDMLYKYITKLLGIILVLFISHFIIKIGYKFIDRLMGKKQGKTYFNERRSKTLKMLLKSILRYAIYFFAGMIILSFLNVPIGSLLAGAGIVGVAVGFGAQNFVKDIINGFFILFEDQFGVGDYIETAGVDGVVEEIGLRTTSIKSFGGELHIIPNSEIGQVTNYCVGSMRVMVDVGISYDEDPDRAIEVLEEMCLKISSEKVDIITEGPTVLGVQELGESSINIRLWARVKPMEQWQMGRYIRKRCKETLDEAGIEIPYPHMVLVPEGDEGEVRDET